MTSEVNHDIYQPDDDGEEEEEEEEDSSDDDDDDEISDTIKNQLLYTVDAMKRYIAMHRVHRAGWRGEKSPLLDVAECTKSLDADRLQMFGQALRQDEELQAIELCLDHDGLSKNESSLAKDIAVFLGKSPKLASLDLNAGSTCTQQPGGVDIKLVRLFLHTYLRNPNARDLALWEIRTVPPNIALPDITKLVSACRALETLKCSDCSLNVATALLQGLILSKTVKHVEFNMDWPSGGNCGRLWQLFCDNIQTLETLRLDSIPMSALESMVHGLALLPNLQSLEVVLQPASIDDDDKHDGSTSATKGVQLIAGVIRQTKSIKNLDLQGFDWSDTRADLLREALVQNASIETLSLAGGGVSIPEALRGTTQLQEFDVSKSHFANVKAEGPKETLNSVKGLKRIRLPLLDNAQVSGLLEGLRQNPEIQSLGFSFSNLSESTVQQIRDTFSSAISLYHLSIRGEGFANNLADTFAGVLDSGTCQLRSLHLSGIPFKADSADALFAALRGNTKLQSLSLDNSGLNVAGSLRIFQHLPFLCHLADLRLDVPEEFDDENEEEFVEAMEMNTSLTRLSLALEESRLVGIAEFFVQRNRTQWMLAEEKTRALWPLVLFQFDDSAKFQWVLALSDTLVSASNKRKGVMVTEQNSETPSNPDR